VVSVVAAAAVVLVALAATALANRVGGGRSAEPSNSDVTASSTVNYSPEELDGATEQLLEASRDGTVPTISFVRSAADRSGLIVGVPRRVVRAYGSTDQLAKIFTDETGLPVQIEVAEVPSNGLPILPSTTR
jgi:hypothetical protein